MLQFPDMSIYRDQMMYLSFMKPFSAGTDFRRQKSDVYRRQILTSKVDPRTERVSHL